MLHVAKPKNAHNLYTLKRKAPNIDTRVFSLFIDKVLHVTNKILQHIGSERKGSIAYTCNKHVRILDDTQGTTKNQQHTMS